MARNIKDMGSTGAVNRLKDKTVRQTRTVLPVHPGEILFNDFMEPMGLTQYRVAVDCGLAPRLINEIVHGKRAVTAATALLLGKFFGVDPQWWMNMQSHYELELARLELADRINRVRTHQIAA